MNIICWVSLCLSGGRYLSSVSVVLCRWLNGWFGMVNVCGSKLVRLMVIVWLNVCLCVKWVRVVVVVLF